MLQLPKSSTKGLKYIDELEKEYSLTQKEKWDINKAKARFLNLQDKQEEYLPIWFKLLKEHRTTKETKLIIEDLYSIASLVMKLGYFEGALPFFDEAYQLSKENKYPAYTNKCLFSLIWILSENKQYKEALVYSREMDTTIAFNSSISDMLTKCYIGINQLDSARLILTKRLMSVDKGKIILYNQMAETYILEGKEDSASIYLKNALVAYQSNKIRFNRKNEKASLPIYFIHTYSKYAELLQKNGKTKQAAEAYQLIEPLMNTHVQSLNWKEKQINAITSYSTFCRNNKQYEKALKQLVYKDSLQQVYNEMKEKQAHMHLVNRFEISDLTHRIEMQDKKLEYSKTLNSMLMCAGTFGSILLLMLYLLFRSRKAQNIKLYQQHEQLQKLEENRNVQEKVPNAAKALYLNAEKKVRTDKLFLKSELSIETLSDLLNTNRTYLSSSINEFTSKSYSIWINDFRIKYAIKLMHDDTTLNMKNLASACGFSSNETFSKNFKQRSGVTPNQYLNQIIIEQNKPEADS